MANYNSWGNYPQLKQTALTPEWLHDTPALLNSLQQGYLPRGNGRSYGDSCLNADGVLVDSRKLDNFISFDPQTGVISAEAGLLLSNILQVVEPHGWFLAVTPGTRFVTLAGAIANDVHGKNHHVRGCFSDHVLEFDLLRSNGDIISCSRQSNAEWFHATVAGLGLTGFITRATLQLMRVNSTSIDTESIRMTQLSDFFSLNEESAKDFEYTVSWIDCLAKGKSRGRGQFIRGNHAANASLPIKKPSKFGIPFSLPFSAINAASLRVFNTLYYHKQCKTAVTSLQSRDSFFYPLDGIKNWNRLYGKSGFLQYQCVIPTADAEDAIAELLGKIASSGQGSFLVVLKAFGDKPTNGLLSFAREGVTLAMDFPNLGDKTLALLNSLDETTAIAGGKLYPAKDARMSAAHFQQFYPEWKAFLPYKDPCISSSFWRRVMTETI